MTASLSASGFVPMSAAIAGSDVAMTVESMFSMNRATATISGTMRFAAIGAELTISRIYEELRQNDTPAAGRHCSGAVGRLRLTRQFGICNR